MPSPDGTMTDEELAKAQAFIAANWKSYVCPFSGPTTWEVGKVIAQATGFSGGSLFVGGPSYPLLVLTCGQCGFTAFVNAIKAGIVTASPQPSPATPEPTAPQPAAQTGG